MPPSLSRQLSSLLPLKPLYNLPHRLHLPTWPTPQVGKTGSEGLRSSCYLGNLSSDMDQPFIHVGNGSSDLDQPFVHLGKPFSDMDKGLVYLGNGSSDLDHCSVQVGNPSSKVDNLFALERDVSIQLYNSPSEGGN